MRKNSAGSNVTFNKWATWTRWRAYPNVFMVLSFKWQSEDAYKISRTLKSP